MKTKEETIKFLNENFKPTPPGQDFKVDFFKPEDAMGVVECCYSVYGDAYPIDTYYIPEKLIKENLNGNIYSVVARTDDKGIIGHGALYRSSPPFKGMYEAGQYIIQKQYRGSGAVQEINKYITSTYPEKLGIAAFYGEPVTNHIITQKMGAKSGTIETALEIDLMPAEAYKAEQSAQGRVSTLLTFKILKDLKHKIFLPAHYLDKIKEDVMDLNLDREIVFPQNGELTIEKSKTEEQFFDFAGVGRLQIKEIGRDIYKLTDDFEKENRNRNYFVTQLFITLNEINVKDLFTHLNEKGYFYGGYLPRWMDSDAILLQKIVPEPTFEGLKLYSDKAKQLLNYIKKDWQRIS